MCVCVCVCVCVSLIHMHIPYRFLLTLSDGGTIKIDLHSNATRSVSNIKSSPSHRDRQTVISTLLPPPPPPPPPFSSQGPRDSHSPPDELYRGVTGCGRGLIDSLLMPLFSAHNPSPTTHTLPVLPPPPPPARALVWVSVIAPGLVPRRLHSTIHTNHSVSAL